MSCSAKWPHAHGASRSIVRRIGSSLPRYSGKRLIVERANRSQDDKLLGGLNSGAEGLVVASYFDETISPDTSVIESTFEGSTESGIGLKETQDHRRKAEKVDAKTKEKISSLESELAALKSRIAAYALAEVERNQASQPPPPPPPPPPAAPPLPSLTMHTPGLSRPVSQTNGKDKCDGVTTSRTEMSTVLKDIGSVRLKAAPFARSPGGTPMRKGQDSQSACDDDPGAIIARALRQKFSNRVFRDSPDKENLDRSDVSISLGFDSPITKPVYQTEVDTT
ncbi:hypothetical protein EMCRGX_G028015 [Ephydatia muelleri]|eukprot:Em0020g636a